MTGLLQGPGARRQHGISLIIAMVMLAVIGLASAAVMRNATSADQVATNNRLQTQANQFAQVALRFCENQLTLAPDLRTVDIDAAPSQAFATKGNWTGGGNRPAHTLAARDMSAAIPPRVAPQCMIAATAMPHVFTVTSRGFSPDFTADTGSGTPRSGSVVWLQSTVLVRELPDPAAAAPGGAGGAAADCGSGCSRTIQQRLWQQLLTPPF